MEIHEKIQFIRNSSGKNKKEFSEFLEVSQPTITRYEDGTRNPEFQFLKKLIENFNVNPEWIFFDIEPPFIDTDEYDLSISNKQLIRDINMIMSPEEFSIKLREILIETTINNIVGDGGEKNIFTKFLDALTLEGHIPFRPLLFLYYIFRYVRDNKDELTRVPNFQNYLLELVKRYQVLSFKNSPAFTAQIKREFDTSIQINLTEDDCKTLLLNYELVLNKLEQKMTRAIVNAHKKIDTTTLFPKK
jgi:transcriptional regulator with XRE-family HTH domain